MPTEPEAFEPLKNSMQADSTYLAQVRQADPRGLELLFNSYSKLVYSIAFRVLRDPSAAEDVLQEVFVQIWRKPDSFIAARGSLGAWLAVTTRNRAIDLLRQRKPTDSVDDIVLPSPHNVAESSERNILIERVRRLAADLPAEQRTMLEMAFFDGSTHAEIAQKTGIPLGTVKTRIRAALSTLGRALRK